MVANIREQIKPYTPPPVPAITVLPAPKPARIPDDLYALQIENARLRARNKQLARELVAISRVLDMLGVGHESMAIIDRVRMLGERLTCYRFALVRRIRGE